MGQLGVPVMTHGVCNLRAFDILHTFGKFHRISDHCWPVESLPSCPFVKLWPRLVGSTSVAMHFDQRSFSFYTGESLE